MSNIASSSSPTSIPSRSSLSSEILEEIQRILCISTIPEISNELSRFRCNPCRSFGSSLQCECSTFDSGTQHSTSNLDNSIIESLHRIGNNGNHILTNILDGLNHSLCHRILQSHVSEGSYNRSKLCFRIACNFILDRVKRRFQKILSFCLKHVCPLTNHTSLLNMDNSIFVYCL